MIYYFDKRFCFVIYFNLQRLVLVIFQKIGGAAARKR